MLVKDDKNPTSKSWGRISLSPLLGVLIYHTFYIGKIEKSSIPGNFCTILWYLSIYGFISISWNTFKSYSAILCNEWSTIRGQKWPKIAIFYILIDFWPPMVPHSLHNTRACGPRRPQHAKRFLEAAKRTRTVLQRQRQSRGKTAQIRGTVDTMKAG